MSLQTIRATLIGGLLCCVLLPTAADATQPADASQTATEKDLLAKENSSWDLAIKKDAAAYKALHAQDFITVSGDGVIGKDQSESSALDPQVSFDHYTLSGQHLSWVQKDVALITYHVVVSGMDHGKKFDGDAYASSIWVKRQGRWENVFYQATPASKK